MKKEDMAIRHTGPQKAGRASTGKGNGENGYGSGFGKEAEKRIRSDESRNADNITPAREDADLSADNMPAEKIGAGIRTSEEEPAESADAPRQKTGWYRGFEQNEASRHGDA